MSPNEIQRKHLKEREAVVDDALRASMNHLIRAQNNFGAVIKDRNLQNEFSDGIGRAQEAIAKLGIDY